MKTGQPKTDVGIIKRSKSLLKNILAASFWVVFILFSFPLPATAAESFDIPIQLKPWKPWVLHNMDARLCPTDYDRKDGYQCVWPSRLALFIKPVEGRFEQHVLVFAKSWLSLPGGGDIWPTAARLADQEVPVINRHGIPSIEVPEGEHVVSGYFAWQEMPEVIRVPTNSGVVELYINDNPVASPVLDQKGRLWLQRRAPKEEKENRLEMRIFRLLDDEIPLTITSHLQLDISGQAREENLPDVLLENAVPMRLESPLPAMIGSQGRLRLQARPGRWTIQITTRRPGPVEKIGPLTAAYGTEIWSFKSNNHLRMVKILGVDAVDPSQADVPAAWKNYPAYVIKPGATMTFKELRRGDPDPAPDRLNLQRTWWLDFDGRGYTIQDNINGIMSQNWYLAMNPPIELGRIAVDGEDQLITMHGKDKKPGVELRRGQLNLQADARLAADADELPAVGWDHDFQSVSAVLNLPPGWRLLTARGVDVLPGTWFQRWTLLDFFIVLIIALAVFKLRNWKWGILALVTMALIYHEVGAPRLVWLHLLAVLALLSVLPAGWLRRLTMLWGLGTVAVLLVVALPFMVHQIRLGIYPQLEKLGGRGWSQTIALDQAVQFEAAPERAKALPSLLPREAPVVPERSSGEWKADYSSRKRAVFTQDPNALIQTGPGLPVWQWRSIRMQWNGPVAGNHKLRLWLLSPTANLVLAFARVILLALLIFGLVDLRYWWQSVNKRLKPAAVAGLLVLMCGWHQPSGAETANFFFPPPEMLQQLQDRLLEKADCYPQCADLVRMDLTAATDSLQFLIEVHAAAQTAVPLPGNLEAWLPDAVLLDEQEVKGLLKKDDGSLWALIPPGIHRLTLLGRTGGRNTLQIPIPLKPHRVTVQAEDWEVQGVHPNGTVDAGIQLIRRNKDSSTGLFTADAVLPPFLSVERVLHLGLNWQMSTVIRRLTPPGIPVVITLPLLESESVTTGGIQVENGRAVVNFDSRTTEKQFTSMLEMAPEIRLQAPRSAAWTETWVLDASPVWHCELSGIPVIHHQDQQGHWRPEWRPWPGETVAVKVTRPQATAGRQMTIDSARLDWTPGKRLNKAGLTLMVRTSRGGQHALTLPGDAELQTVKINDKSQPIRLKDGTVVIPLQPGKQSVYLEWHQPAASGIHLQGPRVAIGEQAVNAAVTFQMPQNKWILWTAGPQLGPAVLFWSYLIVVILAAIGLGRTKFAPLKTHHWLLLSLGLTQISPVLAILIVGWLLALGARGKYTLPDKWLGYNLVQLLLAAWTLVALVGLYLAVERGLLGIPNMQIAGNGSTAFHLRWAQDRIAEFLPRPSVIALPQWIYHLLMLFWSLWLALYLLKWLKWGWQCYAAGGLWKKLPRRKKKIKPPPLPEPQRE